MDNTLDDYNKALDVINELAKEYEGWVRADLARLVDYYEQAMEKPGERDALIRGDFFRTAHDIKGQGATFDYELMTDVGNHLCRYIESQESFGDEQMNVLHQHITAMQTIINHHLTADGGQEGVALWTAIQTLA